MFVCHKAATHNYTLLNLTDPNKPDKDMARHLIRLLVIIFLFAPTSIFAQDDHHSQVEVRNLLLELDTVIANKSYYQEQRKQRISNLETEMRGCYGREYVEKCKEYFQMLVDYNGSRALHALQLIEETPEYKSDIELHQWVAISRSTVYCTMGLYHKAEDMLQSINTKTLAEKERLHYYCTIQSIYSNISEYLPEKDIVNEENNLSIAYMDSILSIQTNEIDRDLTSAVKELALNHPTEALNHALHALYLSKGKTHIYICATLAMVYMSMHDNQNAIYYFALTSINDIKNGTTEYQALIYLIDLLYEEGDMDRATSYLICAMEDVNAYPARNLAIKLSSNVENMKTTFVSRQQEVDSAAKQKSHTIGIIYALSALLICIAFYVFWRRSNSNAQKKEMAALQAELERISLSDKLKGGLLQQLQKEVPEHISAIKEQTEKLSGKNTGDEIKDYMNLVAEHTGRLSALIDNTNNIKNLEAGITEGEHILVNFDELMQLCLSETRQYLKKNVEFIYSPQRKGLRISTNAKQTQQMLTAILTLVAKKTENGAIMLSTLNVAASNCLQICVTNTGAKITTKEAEQMFEKMEYNEDDSSCSGLTLFTCRVIARALGGDLSIDTSYQQGARFVLLIPNNKE